MPASAQNLPEILRKLDASEREILELLVIAPHFYERIAEVVRSEQITHPHANAIYQKCRQLAARGVLPDFQRLLLEIENEQVKTLLVSIDEQARLRRSDELEKRLTDLLGAFRRRDLDHSRRTHTQAIQEGNLAEHEELAAMLKIQEQSRNRQGISAPTEG